MRFLGVIVGLALGAMFGSFQVAIVFAILGAITFPKIYRRGGSKPPLAADSSASENLSPVYDPLTALRMRVATLEQRLLVVEASLAQGTAPSSTPVASEPDPPPEPETRQPEASPMPAIPLVLPDLIPQAVYQASPTTVAEPVFHPAVEVPPTPVEAMLEPLAVTPPPPLRDRLPAPLANLIFDGNVIVKIGVLILFLGLAFLLRYTAERVTVPIEVRYASVALVGAGLLALGWFLRRKRRDYSLALQGAGIGVLYLTVLAAMKVHHLLDPGAGFTFMFAVTVLAAMLAVLQDAPALAIVAALEGFAAPVLASTGENRPLGLLTYLLVLDIGIFLIAWFRAWRVLNIIGAVGTFTLAVGWAQRNYTDDQFSIVQPFLLCFFVMFTIVGLLSGRRTLQESPVNPNLDLTQRAAETLRRVGRVDSTLVFGVPIAAFGLQYLLVHPWEFGAAFSAMAFSAFYLVLGRVVFATQGGGLALLAEAYAVVGVIFATLAIPLGFEGRWTGAAWAVEAAGIYWLGARQGRPYARAFSFLVFAGAVFKLLGDTHFDGTPGQALLQGSLIGPLLVAAGAFFIWGMQRRAKLDAGPDWEGLAGAALPWLGMAALTLLPWQMCEPMWAAVATASLASAAFALAVRRSLMPLINVTYGMQALAVASFVATIHRGGSPQALQGDWQNALAACLIALSVLGSVTWSIRRTHRAAVESCLAPQWTPGSTLALVAGVGLLHLAMLFQIDLQQAALLWPISACVVFWVALRISHFGLAVLAAALQVISAIIVVFYHLRSGNSLDATDAFAHLGFWTPVVLGLAALLCGDWIRAQSSSATDGAGSAAMANHWGDQHDWLWTPVVWGLFWWLFAVLAESARVLQSQGDGLTVPAIWVAILVFTSFVATLVAERRNWTQMGQASLLSLPAWVLIALVGVAINGNESATAFVPSHNWGWLCWPLALLWHLSLLRKQRLWCSGDTLESLHSAGLWFFVLLAARECQWQFGQLGNAWSSWPLLGWVLVPTLVLWALQSERLLKRWPLRLYRQAYLDVGCLPIAACLLVWAWVTNAISAGDAAPIPYLPLVNPLELAHWLTLSAVALWWRTQGPDALLVVPPSAARAVAAVSALAFITGMVLRSCHHFVGVEWQFDALYASRLTQAALSITWAICGVLAMVIGHSRQVRPVWLAGAALMAVVVLKLFFVELADRGGLFRIVSFLSVGALLLAVGYFAPVPPDKATQVLPEGNAA